MAANFDRADILRTASLLHASGDVIELRIPKAGRFKTISGYFDDPAKLADAVVGLADENFSGYYFTINQVRPELLARCANKYQKYAESTTADNDILRRRWLPIDLDPARPAGISSSEKEHGAALELAREIRRWLIEERGWPANAFILADSGNGGHLAVKIDLANDDESKGLIKSCLEALDFIFSDDKIKVDTSTFNAARIWKIYGTKARKGSDTPERPHRLSKIIDAPEELAMVSEEQLEALAAILPKPEQPVRGAGQGDIFNPVKYAEEHGANVLRTKPWQGGQLAILETCPFNREHDRGEAFLGVQAGGAIYFGCKHNSCRGNDWQALKMFWGSPNGGKAGGPKSRIDENVARLEDIKTARIRQKFKPEEMEPEATGPEIFDHEFATDGGNAQRLIRLHKNNIKYCHTFKKWMFWDSHRWKIDGDGSAYRFCDDVIREIYSEAAACVDSKDRSEWAKFAIRSDSGRGYRDMLFLASFNKAIAITSDLLDCNPWLLNTKNFTINLKTFEAREPRREDLITKTIGTRYDPTAECPLWMKFLDKIFGGDQELINYVQRAAGYSLTGSMVEQIYFFCHGTGANGKSVFLATLRTLAGDFAKQASFDTFLIQHTVKVRNDLAALAGARIITASEAEEGSKISMQVIKSWTGGDPITARFLFGEDFTFKPCGKIWLAANTKPVISERNYAAWRRVHLIPFLVTIPLEEQDRELENKLLEELPGILIWALEGLKEYHRIGLLPPEAVKAATDAYRRENDSLAGFLSECCEVRKLALCKNSDLFSAYLSFCRMSGEETISQKKFSEDLAGMPGIKKTRDRAFGMIWHGVQLSKNWSEPENANHDQARCVKDVKPNPQSFETSPYEANFSGMPSHPSQTSPDSDSKKSNPSRSEEEEGPKMSKRDMPTPGRQRDDPKPDKPEQVDASEKIRIASMMEFGQNGAVDPAKVAHSLNLPLAEVVTWLDVHYMKLERSGVVRYRQHPASKGRAPA